MKINSQTAMMIEYAGFKSPQLAKGPRETGSGHMGKPKETALIVSPAGKKIHNGFSHRGQYIDLLV